ncbi:MAG: hypothetical protein AB1Z23_12545 [Eubacteriales bacterium]
MNCKKCGAELEENAKKCPECKKKVKKEIPKKKKVVLIISIAAAFLISAVGGYFTYEILTKNAIVDDFTQVMDAGQYEDAYSIYTDHKSFLFFSDEKVEEELNDGIFRLLDEKQQKFLNGEDTDNSLIGYMQNISESYAENIDTGFIGDFHDLLSDEYINNDQHEEGFLEYLNTFYSEETDEIKEIEKYAKNRGLYREGEELYAKEKYEEAYKKYKSVKSFDELYYEDAQAKVDECFGYITEAEIAVMKEYMDNGEYEEALAEEKIYRSFLRDSEPAKELIAEIKQKFKDDVFAQADEKVAENDYKGAINLISEMKGYVLDDDVRNKEAEIEDEYTEYAIERMKFLKTKLKVVRDSDDENDIVIPKSYRFFSNLSEETSVSVYIARYDDGVLFLVAIFGFPETEKIYFEKMKFYYDGESSEWSIDTSDRRIESYRDGKLFVEIYVVVYDPYDPEESTTLTANLLEVLNNISDGSGGKIKFIGKDDVSHKLTEDEILSLQYITEAYELLDEFPELWKYLK